jgi:outer membrane receptor protein involved in Fe transport
MKTLFTFRSLFLLTVLTALLPLQSFAQKGNAKITGTVMDSVTQKPVEFANVALTNRDSSTPIDGAVCDDKGEFTINKVAPGSYKLLITFIGFETRVVNIQIEDKKDDINLGKIIIAPTPQILKEVTVEGQKALIEEKVDRTVYNAENDATAKGGDATDVLKRVPMLSVDLDGNVSLRGNSNIMVLVNNKPSTIMASNIADALKQIPADQIKTVEVITSPSAKYDAEGSAGIINIITKKNTLEGVTLNVDAGAGLRGSNLGLNGNYRKGKMGFSLGGWGRSNYNVHGSFRNEQLSGTTLNVQHADTRNHGLFGNYNLGWDYDIDKKNALAASVRFGVRNNSSFQDDLTTELFNNDILTRSTLADVSSKETSNNVDANFTYTHYYTKPQRELSFQGLFSRNNRNSDFENIYKGELNSDLVDRLNKNDSYNQEITLQADYQTPINTNQMLEFGGKNISRKVISDFQTFEATGSDGSYQPSVSGQFTNNLNYDQNVTAAYLNYTLTTKTGYSFKAGSRYEYTTISAYTKTEDDIKIPSYGVVVPSINVSKRLKNGNTLKASYNRRIQRPSIRFLNPNIQWQNNLNITQGNPELTPEYTNNYELAYSTLLKGTMLNFSTFVRNTNDAIQSVRDTVTIDDNLVNRTTYHNIGSENAYGTSIFANVNVGKLSLNGGTDIFYAVLNNNNPDPQLRASNQGWVASGRIFGSYNLSKGWGFQFFSFYRGRQVQLQGTQGGFYMYSVAIRKEFNEKRGSIGLGVENFLQSGIKIRTKIESPAISQSSLNVMNNMSIRLNFSYRIGKMSTDAPRRRKSINNDDLKDGGGDNGMSGGMDNSQPQQQRGQGQAGAFGGARPNNAQPKPNVQAPASPSDTVKYAVDGTWNFTIDSPQGGSGTIVLKNENGVFAGTIKTNRMQQETVLNNVVVKGNDVSFNYPVNFGGNAGTVEVKYRVNNADINGTMSVGQFGTFNLTGKRSN